MLSIIVLDKRIRMLAILSRMCHILRLVFLQQMAEWKISILH